MEVIGSPPPGPRVRAHVAGHVVELTAGEVRRALTGVAPGPIRDHYVEVDARRYPVKQALAAATGLDPADFTSQHARSLLRRLALPLGRSSRHDANPGPAQLPRRDAGEKGEPEDRGERLRPYRNRWVALQRDHVLVDGDSFGDVLRWLRDHRCTADAVFLVPEAPDRLSHGLTG